MDTTKEMKFWKWFVQNESEILDFERDLERIFSRLAKHLTKVDPDLVFEFGPKQSQREFIISAGGIKRAFPAVAALVAAAPALEHWKVIGFRPRRELSVIELANRRVDPDQVYFTLLDNEKIAGINLFIPGFKASDMVIQQIGYLMLDSAIGEYDVETKLGLIEILAPEAVTQGDRFPLRELPARLDELIAGLDGRPSTH